MTTAIERLSEFWRFKSLMEIFGRCDCCGVDDQLSGLTDHPDFPDGYYCVECDPTLDSADE